MSLGQEVKLTHAKFIRPYVQGNKTNAADAKAICTVAGKTEYLALHRMRL